MNQYPSQTPLDFDQPNLLNTSAGVQQKSFLANVFIWMFVALSVSAVTAYAFANSETLFAYIYQMNGRRTGLGSILMFMPLAFVLVMSFAWQRLSVPALSLVFLLYSVVNGISLSIALIIFSPSSVISCFTGAAVMFGLMAFMGYKTQQDLTSFGRLLFMGLIGMIIMSVVNFFMHSNTMGYIIGAIGVAVFTGLTAYDVQKLKNISMGIDANGDAMEVTSMKKLAIIGALNLYLDFINIFWSLLRLFGRSRD